MSALRLDTYKAEGCWYQGENFSALLAELIYNPSICNLKPEVFIKKDPSSSNNGYCLFLCKKIERVVSIEVPTSDHINLLSFELLDESETEPTHLLANFGRQGTYYITASARMDRTQYTSILSLPPIDLFEQKHLLSDKTRQAIEASYPSLLQNPNDHKDQPPESKDDDEDVDPQDDDEDVDPQEDDKDVDSQEDDTEEEMDEGSEMENSEQEEPPLFSMLRHFMEIQRKKDARQEIYGAFGFDTQDEEEEENEEEEEYDEEDN